ncbi:hypothetical protein JXC34_02650, partial [Candidatus Woesearchaeota archaeon]|nr:hypothetical protein [Candidatus Woesearchaeota archaeon]
MNRQFIKKKDFVFLMLLFLLSVFNVLLFFTNADNYTEIKPIIEKMQDSDYLSRDFYTQTIKGFNVRFFHAVPIAFLDSILNNLDISFIIFFIFSFSILNFTMYLFLKKLTGIPKFSFVTVMALQYVDYVHLGGLSFLWFRPDNLSYVAIFASFIMFMKKKNWLGYFVLGFSVLFQPILGLQMFCTFLFCNFFTLLKKMNLKAFFVLFMNSTGFFLSSSLNLIPLFILNLKTASPGHSLLISKTMGIFMHAFHCCPSTWLPVQYILFGTFILSVLVAASRIKIPIRIRKNILPYTIVTLLFCIAGFVFTEIFPISFVSKAQFFRVLVFFSVAGYIAIFKYVYEQIEKSGSVIKRTYYILLPLCFFFDPGIFLGTFL